MACNFCRHAFVRYNEWSVQCRFGGKMKLCEPQCGKQQLDDGILYHHVSKTFPRTSSCVKFKQVDWICNLRSWSLSDWYLTICRPLVSAEIWRSGHKLQGSHWAFSSSCILINWNSNLFGNSNLCLQWGCRFGEVPWFDTSMPLNYGLQRDCKSEHGLWKTCLCKISPSDLLGWTQDSNCMMSSAPRQQSAGKLLRKKNRLSSSHKPSIRCHSNSQSCLTSPNFWLHMPFAEDLRSMQAEWSSTIKWHWGCGKMHLGRAVLSIGCFDR